MQQEEINFTDLQKKIAVITFLKPGGPMDLNALNATMKNIFPLKTMVAISVANAAIKLL